MRFVGNFLWHIPYFGIFVALIDFICGLLLVVTVVGAPIGLGLIEMGKFHLAPFTYSLVDAKDLGRQQNSVLRSYGLILSILYFPIGLILAIFVISHALACIVSIIGIPAGLASLKSLGTLINPVNKVCVHYTVAEEIVRKKYAAAV